MNQLKHKFFQYSFTPRSVGCVEFFVIVYFLKKKRGNNTSGDLYETIEENPIENYFIMSVFYTSIVYSD